MRVDNVTSVLTHEIALQLKKDIGERNHRRNRRENHRGVLIRKKPRPS